MRFPGMRRALAFLAGAPSVALFFDALLHQRTVRIDDLHAEFVAFFGLLHDRLAVRDAVDQGEDGVRFLI